MYTATPAPGTICWFYRVFKVMAALLLLFGLMSALAQPASAQTTNQLTLANNFFVTGDYVVGGVGLRGLGDASGFAKGTISIPDSLNQPNATSVPAGSDIVPA